MLIDTHAHLCDEQFNDDRQEIIQSFSKENVASIVEVGYDIESSRKAVALAQKHSNVYAAIGIHPCDNIAVTDAVCEELISLARHPKVVALGEVGLDFHYENDKEIQRYNFGRMLSVARIINKPIILHLRDAFGEFNNYKEQLEQTNLSLLFHCYAGSLETTAELIKCYGDRAYFAFGGVITFKNFKKQEVVKAVPRDRLLIETDCPYMSPAPHRGERNTPIFVRYVAEKMAEILDKSYEDIVNITNANAKRLFHI